jgi:uncharacterized membrane protein YphA (DoxX/SURF4 family)
MILEDLGSLVIRVALGWLFVTGAWASGKDKAARDFTTSETALVFKWRPEIFACLGILMLALSGLSVLFGVFPRLGALIMTVFLVPAAMIHFAKRGQAEAFKDQIAPVLSRESHAEAKSALEALTANAVFGHFTAGLKTLCLLGPSLYLVLAGAREPMLIGLGADGHWHGLLTRL